MISKMEDGFHPQEVRPTETFSPESEMELAAPTMKELEIGLEETFAPAPSERPHLEPTVPITLEDGSVVHLPGTTEAGKEAGKTGVMGFDNAAAGEVKPTRELTEAEKTELKEKLGWTDAQISKCTIDEDGVIHYKTDREDMEGKTGENGVKYERKTVDIHGVQVQGVFPVFDSVCDVQLPSELETASNTSQFRECNEQLKEKVEQDPKLRESFSEEQLEEIAQGKTPSGYQWHHNEETGKMQLVKAEDHDRTQGGAAHTGGKTL
ncbi:MAG: HNH endonuclease [Candidatus Spyradocola sp.]